jgi:hypothetical protein
MIRDGPSAGARCRARDSPSPAAWTGGRGATSFAGGTAATPGLVAGMGIVTISLHSLHRPFLPAKAASTTMRWPLEQENAMGCGRCIPLGSAALGRSVATVVGRSLIGTPFSSSSVNGEPKRCRQWYRLTFGSGGSTLRAVGGAESRALARAFAVDQRPMAISVTCGSCRTRFSVSEKFAGQTGACPKCKKPLTVPKADAVQIHAPDAPSATSAGGQFPTKPFPKRDKPVSTASLLVCGGLALASFVTAGAIRFAWPANEIPAALLGAAALVVAFPCVLIGYAMVRNRDLEPYMGRPLLLRALICSVVYAGLWGAHAFLPPESTQEMWQWLFIGPIFFGIGALAALASLELDWGPAVVHFSLYVMVTVALRWIAGFSPPL